MGPKVVDRGSKQEEIIQGAVRAFQEKGVQNATIQDIADRTGIGKGTIYEYFKSKEEIFHATYAYFVMQMDAVFRRTMEGASDPLEKIRRIIHFLPAFLEGNTRPIMGLIFDFWSLALREDSTRGDLLDTMKEFYSGYNDLVSSIILEGMTTGVFTRDLNPDKTAAIITGALDGLLVQWLLDPDSMDFGEAMDQFEHILSRGMQSQP